jgi:hypothetical protein
MWLCLVVMYSLTQSAVLPTLTTVGRWAEEYNQIKTAGIWRSWDLAALWLYSLSSGPF